MHEATQGSELFMSVNSKLPRDEEDILLLLDMETNVWDSHTTAVSHELLQNKDQYNTALRNKT